MTKSSHCWDRPASRTLRTTVLLWKRDQPIPADLAARLAVEGFDAPALETRYRP